jgi:hypothetical protein
VIFAAANLSLSTSHMSDLYSAERDRSLTLR